MTESTKKPQAATEFKVVIVTPDNVLFENSCSKLLCPGLFQDIAILPDHTPLYALLKEGSITATLTNKKTENIDIDGGILRVRSNTVSIAVGFDVEPPENPKNKKGKS